MATLNVAEYGDDAFTLINGQVVPVEPTAALVEQTQVTYTTSAQSAAVGAKTTIVRLIASAAAHIALGTNPTATAASRKIAANVVSYFRVPKGEAYKIAAYDGTT